MINTVFFSFCFLIFSIGYLTKERKSGLFTFFLITLLILYSGLRGDVGSDTYSYSLIYEDSFLYFIEGMASFNFQYEPFFLLFTAIHSYFISDLTNYFFLISFIQGWLLWRCSRTLSSKWIFLISYVLVFYLDFHFNVLRAALAGLLFLNCLVDQSRAKTFVFLILAVLCQFTVIFLVPIIFFRSIPKGTGKRILLFVAVLAFFVLFFIMFQDYIISKLKAYNIMVNGESGIGFSLSFFRLLAASLITMLAAYLVFLRKKVDTQIKVSFLILVISSFIMSFFPIFFRVYTLSLLATLYLVCRHGVFHNFTLKKYQALAFSLILWQAFGSLSYVYSHYDSLPDSDYRAKDFSITNYELYTESDYR